MSTGQPTNLDITIQNALLRPFDNFTETTQWKITERLDWVRNSLLKTAPNWRLQDPGTLLPSSITSTVNSSTPRTSHDHHSMVVGTDSHKRCSKSGQTEECPAKKLNGCVDFNSEGMFLISYLLELLSFALWLEVPLDDRINSPLEVMNPFIKILSWNITWWDSRLNSLTRMILLLDHSC